MRYLSKSLFFLSTLFLLNACNYKEEQTANNTNGSTPSKDTPFQKIFIDSIKFPNSKVWDYRYYYRVKSVVPVLKLDSLENGVEGFEMRLWRISSYFSQQELFVIKEINQSWELTRYQFNVDVQTWPALQKPKPDISVIKKSTAIPVSKSFIDSLSIDSLWTSISGSDLQQHIEAHYLTTEGGHSVCIELADKHRYKFDFYLLPDKYNDDLGISKKIMDRIELLKSKF